MKQWDVASDLGFNFFHYLNDMMTAMKLEPRGPLRCMYFKIVFFLGIKHTVSKQSLYFKEALMRPRSSTQSPHYLHPELQCGDVL